MADLNFTHSELTDVQPYAITICKQGANRKRIYLKKDGEEPEGTTATLPAQHRILKEDDAWETFYCVVAEPGHVEDPGQTGSAPDVWADEGEIRKAAHAFAKSPMLVNAFHESLEPYGAVVENFIAQADFEVGGETIKKDSWVVGVAPTAEGRAQIDSGELTGISIEAMGTRTLVQKSIDWADAYVSNNGNVSVTISGQDESVWKKIAGWLKTETSDSATIQKTTEEDSQVPEDKNTNEGLTPEQIEEKIAKATSPLQSAVEGLVGTVNGLVERLDAKNAPEETEEEKKGKLQKSLDKMTDDLLAMREEMAQIAAGSSSQTSTEPVQKSSADDWRIGMF